MFDFVLLFVSNEFDRATAARCLNSISHLRIVVDVLNDEDLSHLENDQELHRYELVQEQVEGEECVKGLFRSIRRVVKDVLTRIIVFLDKNTRLAGVDGRDRKLQGNIESHESIDTLVEAGLLESIFALVHDQLAVSRGVDNEAAHLLRIAKCSAAMHELFQVDISLLTAILDTTVKTVEVSNRCVTVNLELGTGLGVEQTRVYRFQCKLGLQVRFAVK